MKRKATKEARNEIDRTMVLDAQELEAQAPTPVDGEPPWPSPQLFEIKSSSVESGPRECALVHRDGHVEVGKLVQFRPDAGFVDFRAARQPEVRSVDMSAVKLLRLILPVSLAPRELPLRVAGETVFPERERQEFTLTYVDGEQLTGECYGFAHDAYGHYIFLAAPRSRQAFRLFVPAGAYRSFALGAPLGEILERERHVSHDAIETAVDEQRRRRSKRVGEYLAENAIITREQLDAAIRSQSGKPNAKLGDLMVELGLITRVQLDDALYRQASNRRVPLGEILVEMGLVDRDTIRRVLASKLGVPFLRLQSFQFDFELLKLVPREFCASNTMIPVLRTPTGIVIATEDPFSYDAMDQLKFHLQTGMITALADGEDIHKAIEKQYAELRRVHGKIEPSWLPKPGDEDAAVTDIANVAAALEEPEEDGDASASIDSALVRLVNKVILDAHAQGASDVHIECYPGKRNVRIRFRVDGELRDYVELASRLRQAIVSRLKIMANLDISERRKSQDGKINFARFGPARLELRVATIPTSGGLEDVVLRLLAGARALPLDALRLEPRNLEALRRLALQPHGLLIVCGPTGSGKTTTLHSALAYLNTSERKILTAEDPVEITQPGLRQVQVNHRIGWGFAEVLRAFLRADPDVIMVGEMRDRDTTQIGLEASLTGHLVLTTLHTNSAAESVVRVLDMGVDPFNFADALLGVLAQRLARQLCPKCAQRQSALAVEVDTMVAEYAFGVPPSAIPDPERLRREFADEKGRVYVRKPVGCAHCHGTGYKGRVGVHELLSASGALKHLVRQRADTEEILAQALADGMRTLRQDGIGKVLQGLTDMAQVRVTCG